MIDRMVVDGVMSWARVTDAAVGVMNRGTPHGNAPPDHLVMHDSPPGHPRGAVPDNASLVDDAAPANNVTRFLGNRRVCCGRGGWRRRSSARSLGRRAGP